MIVVIISTKIDKANNHLSPQTIKHKKKTPHPLKHRKKDTPHPLDN
jgi:hypothetical protein